MMDSRRFRHLLPAGLYAAFGALLAACGSSVPLPPPSTPVSVAPPAESAPPTQVAVAPIATSRTSQAVTPRAYRQDAASHLYGQNAPRIFKGRLPPLLYAIGVLQVEVDRDGHVQKMNWMRAPKHAPEVMAEIERTVRAAAPFPAPVRMGKVVYTDTWLWDRSGRFQLDTLTEGQD
jgi:protein TonB